MPKNAEKFHCKKCNFTCYKKSNYDKHLLTRKHNNVNGINQKNAVEGYTCDVCNKTFKDRSGLWRHKKQCTYQDSKMETTNVAHSDEINELKEFMKYLMQENSEMKNMMMEVIKNGTVANSHNTISTNNSHNKAAL